MGKSVSAQLGSEYVTTNAVQYLSFATFEQGFSLLHPYWPENIFGKVGFMKPEFLLLAVIAYTSFIFSPFKNSHTRRYILFFAILGLIGSFLAKGANEPFGNIYVWLFQHFPGFMMFRDPTKWYTLIAVSYSVLIPFSIKSIFDLLNNQPKSTFSRVIAFNIKSKVLSLNIQNIFLIGVLLYLLFLIKPALFGELRGTFIPHTIPDEYIKLEGFLSSQPQFFRTFWVPTVGRYGLRSEQYPAVSAQEYFRIYDKGQLLKKLKENGIEKKLQELSVKYLIVPYDSEGEIFLNDRKYDNRQYVKTIKEIEKISWLKRVASFRQIGVFELNDAKTHFFSPQNRDLSFTYRNPTEYIVYVKNAKKNDLIVFSESFDSHWVANIGGNLIQSDPYNKLFNSFRLPKDGSYTFMVYYAPQKFVNIGLVVSIFTIFLVSGGLFILKKHD
ncbi:MAG: hypothetical protein HYT10_01690 [Candidatus Levybacteria bacterium]|nr:hypothetical protein [Candidatus Levybacteria bacterium]